MTAVISVSMIAALLAICSADVISRASSRRFSDRSDEQEELDAIIED